MNTFYKKEGFTVVELIVAMSVFIILLTISVGAFVQALRSERRLIALMAINSNAGAVLEQMAREIRTGYGFTCASPPCSASSLSFKNYKGNAVMYSFAGGAINRTESGGTSAQMSAADVDVKAAAFTVSRRVDISQCNPWRITITMEVGSKNSAVTQTTELQTTVSSRVLPVEAPDVTQAILTNCQLRQP